MEEGDEVSEKKKPCLEVNEKEQTAIRKALQNDAVLRGIVRNLKSTETLKVFRTLNQKCYQVGIKALLDSEKGCEHLQGELQINASMTEEQKEYLLQYGSEARRVSLNFGAVTKGSVEDIRKIIFSGLRENMEVLALQFNASCSLQDLMDGTTLLFRQNDLLPNLRSIHLPLTSRMNINDLRAYFAFSNTVMPAFVRKLLSVAVNLKEIHNVDERLLGIINDAERAEAVKSLCLPQPLTGDDDWHEIDDITQKNVVAFKSSRAKLSKVSAIELNIQNPNLKAILEASKETLRQIQIPPYHGYVRPGLREQGFQDFPVLPMILSADLFTVMKLHQRIGAQQFALSLPNLEKVEVNAEGWSYFQRSPVRLDLPTVQSLFMNFDPGTTAGAVMDQLVIVFPSVKSVTINWHEFSKNWTTNAEVWNHLPKQTRRIRLYNFELEKYDNYGLDDLLTGVPKNICKDFQKLKKDEMELDRLRTKPSISSLKNLKSLKFYVVGDFKLEDVRTKDYLSQLSLWGALDHLPGFKLEFILPEDLIRDGNLKEVKRLLQPVAEVSSVSFYKRK